MAEKLAIVGAAVMAAAVVAVPVDAGAVDGSVVTETFEFTGDTQTFTVPDGVTQVEVVACGAQGASQSAQTRPGGVGGMGGEAHATITVTPREVLTVLVGGAGFSNSGGFNGGGTGFGSSRKGGGGASDVRQGGAALSDRVVVGGGGGGAGAAALLRPIRPGEFEVIDEIGLAGGRGGGIAGGSGEGSEGGGGATETAGGRGRFGAEDGTLGQGGTSFDGSGGGGGLYGGGGGGFLFGPTGGLVVGVIGPGGGGSGLGDSFEPGVCEGDGWVTISYEEPPVVVDVDVKPGSDPNPINTESKGVVPVAILTTGDFDATTVDPPTVHFARAAPLRWTYEDVDVDGDIDLVLHYRTRDTAIAVGDTDACVEGTTFEGVPVNGCDSITVRR